MARDTADEPVERSLLDRRKYLKLAGVAAAAVTSTAGATSVSANRERVNIVDAGADPTGETPIDGVLQNAVGDGVEVYFPSGTYRVDSVTLDADNYALVGDDATIIPGTDNAVMLHLRGNDWAFDGFEIDNTVTGQMPHIWVRSSGTDWEVKNVDVTGQVGGSGFRVFFGSVRNQQATGRYENITATDGSAEGSNANATAAVGAFYVSQHHVGTLTLDNVDIRNFWSRGIYHSGVSTGAVRIVDSYWENNRVNIRLSGTDCVVRNTTVKQTVNKPGPGYCVWLRANRESPSSKVHAQAYDALIEGCEFIVDGTDSANPPAHASAINGGTGHSNQYFGSFTVRDCDIRITGADAVAGVEAGPQSYPTATSGRPPEDVTVENTTIVTDGSANGVSIEGRDDSVVRSCCIDAGGQALDFTNASVSTSDITRGSCSDYEDETTEDEETDQSDETTEDEETDQSDSSHTVTISGDSGTVAEYELSVSGSIEKSTAGGASIDDEDSVSDNVAEGAVAGGTDAYEYSGEITGFDASADVTVTVDGSRVDSDSFPSVESELPNVLVVDGGSNATVSTYEFEVSGDAQKDPELGSINAYDTISDGTISGRVIGGTDAFRFSGKVTGFRVDGSATVSLNSN